ncbi:PspC domain-containing protein [Promicromonospora sukumoe]|uniref:PspC domain-containing protein n=1 Tax=Promicromonospora sukumoe TaxID=88382 RepID=UPI0037C9418E
MSTDETRPEDATREPGGPADAGSFGPDPVQPAAHAAPDAAAGPNPGPAPAGPGAPGTGPTSGAPGAPGAPAAPGPKPYPETGFFASIRRGLFPRSDQRWVGGVAGGLAERIGWDPLLVRGLLIVSFFLGGLGLILYGLGWALLPERDGRIHLQEAIRGNFDVAMLGAVAVFLIGFSWGGPLGWWDDGGWHWLVVLFWLAVLGVTLYLIVQGVQRARDNNVARGQGYVPGPVGTPGNPGNPGTPGAPTGTPGAPGTSTGTPTPGAPSGPGTGTSAHFTPAPQVDYRRNEGLVYATGAGPRHQGQPLQSQYRPAPTATLPPQPVYAAPRVRTSRGPGGAAVGITLGVILLAGALLLAAHRLGEPSYLLDGGATFLAAWLGIGTVALGVAILVSGLRGRTSGWLGFFAIVALVFGVGYVGIAGTAGPRWVDDAVVSGRQIEGLVNENNNPDAATITEGTIAVQTVREAENGFYVQWGDPTIDLSELDLSRTEPGDPVVVPIQLGAGQTVVVVPQDAAVEADAYVAAGVVRWTVDDQDRSTSGVGSTNYFASDEVGDEGAVLSLQIEAGAGEVIVTESN